MLLHAWLIAMASGGLLFNYWLNRWLRRPNSANSWGRAVVYGVATHLVVGGGLISAANYANGVYDEEIGYYVGTFVLAFVSIPVAQVGFFQPRRT